MFHIPCFVEDQVEGLIDNTFYSKINLIYADGHFSDIQILDRRNTVLSISSFISAFQKKFRHVFALLQRV